MRLSVRVRALIGLCLVLGALLASYSIAAAQESGTVDTTRGDGAGAAETVTVETTPMRSIGETMTAATMPMDAADDAEMMTELPPLSTPTAAVIVPVMAETPTVAEVLDGLGEATRECDASVGLVPSLELGDSDECNGLRVEFRSARGVRDYEYPSHFGGYARQAVASDFGADFFLVAEVELVNVLSREISNLPLRNRFFVRDDDEAGMEWESSRYLGLDGLPDKVTLAAGDSISGKIQFELPSEAIDDLGRLAIVHRYWEELDTRRFRESAAWLLEGVAEGLDEVDDEYEYEPLVEFIGPLPPTLPLDLGQTAAANGFQFTVLNYGFYSSYTYTEGVVAQAADAVLYEGLFVAAEVEMVNATEHWKYLSMTDFMLWDEGPVLSAPLTTQRHNNLPSRHYAPGVRYRGYLVFEVREHAPGARLLWYAGEDPAGGPSVASFRLPRPDDVGQHLSLEDDWHAVGHAVDEGSVRIAITGVEADDPDSPEGRKLLFVDLEVSNIGVEEIDFSGQLPTVHLRDEDGDLPPARIDLGDDDYTLLPSERATVRLIFSVPARSEEAWFFSDSPETSVRTIWAWGAHGTPGSVYEVGASQQAYGLRTTVKSAFFTKSYAYPSVFGGADREAHAHGAFVILDIEHANVGDGEIVRRGEGQFIARDAVDKGGYRSRPYRGPDALPEMFTLAPGETIAGKVKIDVYEQADFEVLLRYDSTGPWLLSTFNGFPGRDILSDPWLVPFPDDFALFVSQASYGGSSGREAIAGPRPAVESLELGQTASRGKYQAVLTDYSLHPSIRYTANYMVRDFMPERPGEVILVADFDALVVVSDYWDYLSGTEFGIWDDSGNIYYPRVNDLVWREEFRGIQGPRPTRLIFDVPEDISGAQLVWHPGITATDRSQLVAAWTLSSTDVGEERALVGDEWLELGQAAVGDEIRRTVTSVSARDVTRPSGYPEKIITVEYEFTNTLDVPNSTWRDLILFYHDPTDGRESQGQRESGYLADDKDLKLGPGETVTLRDEFRVSRGADEVWASPWQYSRAVWHAELDD